jgi:eukaryotic-like serine/threonine-protein kinase
VAGIADFLLVYRLASPASRKPRFAQHDIERAFAGERCRFLGSGSFGETWRIGDRYAAKVIANDSFPPERIEREIQAARVDHANVVKLEEVREVDLEGEKRVVLLFRFVKGTDLATKIASDGSVDDEDDLRALAQGMFSGLAAIHAERVIHRDVKPENVQLRMGGLAKPVILDLGLAYVADLSSLTRYPNAVGTAAFMPPEVLRGEHAIARSDVFAAGVTLYIAATGKHPWLDDGTPVTNVEYAAMIADGAPEVGLRDDQLKALIRDSLHPKAFRRPTAAAGLERVRM